MAMAQPTDAGGRITRSRHAATPERRRAVRRRVTASPPSPEKASYENAAETPSDETSPDATKLLKRRMANREYARRARSRRQESIHELSDQVTSIQQERETIIGEIRRYELSKVRLQQQMGTLMRSVETFIEENSLLQEEYNLLLGRTQLGPVPGLPRTPAQRGGSMPGAPAAVVSQAAGAAGDSSVAGPDPLFGPIGTAGSWDTLPPPASSPVTAKTEPGSGGPWGLEELSTAQTVRGMGMNLQQLLANAYGVEQERRQQQPQRAGQQPARGLHSPAMLSSVRRAPGPPPLPPNNVVGPDGSGLQVGAVGLMAPPSDNGGGAGGNNVNGGGGMATNIAWHLMDQMEGGPAGRQPGPETEPLPQGWHPTPALPLPLQAGGSGSSSGEGLMVTAVPPDEDLLVVLPNVAGEAVAAAWD